VEFADHNTRAGLDDGGLFGGDFLERVTELRHVIVGDARDDCEFGRRDDVGGVETSSESRFQDSELDACLAEGEEGDQGHRFEERQVRRLVEDAVDPIGEALVRDRLAGDANALRAADEMRGCVEADLLACRLPHRREERRHRAFAVRAGDVHRAERALRVTKMGAGLLHRPELLALTAPGEAVEAGEGGLEISHESLLAWAHGSASVSRRPRAGARCARCPPSFHCAA